MMIENLIFNNYVYMNQVRGDSMLGYTNNVLRVDLTEGKINEETVDDDVWEKVIGGGRIWSLCTSE